LEHLFPGLFCAYPFAVSCSFCGSPYHAEVTHVAIPIFTRDSPGNSKRKAQKNRTNTVKIFPVLERVSLGLQLAEDEIGAFVWMVQ
jgi:hypothetical protein